jgi:hypothetical protein
MRSTIRIASFISILASSLSPACSKTSSGVGDASTSDGASGEVSDLASPEAPSEVGPVTEGGAGSDAPDARTGVCGCARAPLCGQTCQGPCGCCPCAAGETLESGGSTYLCSTDLTCFDRMAAGDASGG